MQKSLLSIIYILLVAFVTFAQDKVKTPPRDIVSIPNKVDINSFLYNAPRTKELKEFVPKDKSFTIIFPGTPNVSEEKTNNGSFTIYHVTRPGGESTVISFDFDSKMPDSEKIYELTKSNLLNDTGSRIQFERDIVIEGKPAKELEIVSPYQFQKVDVLIFGNRVYHIFNKLNNWHDLNEKKVNEFKKETTRFFSTFKITNGSVKK